MDEDPRRKSIIFCNTSLSLSISVKIYSRLISGNLDIQVVKSYKDAIELALELLHIERMDLDSRTFEICKYLNKNASSLFTVELLTETFLNVQSHGYSCPSFVIDKTILHSTNTGYFRVEHIPLIGQMIADCHTTNKDISIKYNVVDCKDFKGIHPNARIKHMEAMKKWHQQYPLKMLIMYNVSASMKAALYIANALMPFKVRVAENIQHAFQIVNANEKNTQITVTQKGHQHLSITQNDIEELVSRIGNLHWDGEFGSPMGLNNAENTGHPLYPIYTAINLIKEEIDALFQERRHADQEKEKLIQKLQNALNEINTLSGLIPICSSCKKIRDDEGYWNILETYIQKHSDALFSHSICPECSDKFYGDEDWYIEMKKQEK